MRPVFTYPLIIATFLTASCREHAPRSVDDEHIHVISELVVLRTEGLALAEVAASATRDEQVGRAIGQVKAYYIETHPAFLKLCQGQVIVLAHDDFATICAAVEHQILGESACVEMAFLSLYTDHTARQIAAYERVLRKSSKEDLYAFALRALPGLYHQQREISAIVHKHACRDSTLPVAGQ